MVFHFLKENKHICVLAVVVVAIITAFLFGSNGESFEVNSETHESTEGVEESNEIEKTSDQDLYVDISGEVKKPGVYKVKNGSRIFEVIEKAGGLTKKADTSTINQAEKVTDGQKIVISREGETVSTQQVTSGINSSGAISINDGSSEELQTIPGVGPATAEKIIAYRTSNGGFKTLEELKNVNGIGDKTFEKMKNYICL